MTLDQPKLAHSRLLVADAFTRDRAAAQKPDPHDTATWLLEQLQAAGWRPPPDPGADIPPLRPTQVAGDDSPGRREFAEARAALALPHSETCTPELRGQGQYAGDCSRCLAFLATERAALAARRNP